MKLIKKYFIGHTVLDIHAFANSSAINVYFMKNNKRVFKK